MKTFLVILPLLASCATTGGQAFTMAFKTCAVSALPSQLESLKEDAVKVLVDGADIKLVGVAQGISLGTSTLGCVVAAAVAALEAQVSAAAALRAQIDPRVPKAIERGRAFLNANR